MLHKFGVYCIKCKEKSKPHIHRVNEIIEFNCLNCGESEILDLDIRYMPRTEKERQMIIERDKIQGELHKLHENPTTDS